MGICNTDKLPKAYIICQSKFKRFPNTKWNRSKWPKFLNVVPKWRNFAKSGHTVYYIRYNALTLVKCTLDDMCLWMVTDVFLFLPNWMGERRARLFEPTSSLKSDVASDSCLTIETESKKLDELEERDNCFDTRIGTFVLKSMIASFFLKYPTKE